MKEGDERGRGGRLSYSTGIWGGLAFFIRGVVFHGGIVITFNDFGGFTCEFVYDGEIHPLFYVVEYGKAEGMWLGRVAAVGRFFGGLKHCGISSILGVLNLDVTFTTTCVVLIRIGRSLACGHYFGSTSEICELSFASSFVASRRSR